MDVLEIGHGCPEGKIGIWMAGRLEGSEESGRGAAKPALALKLGGLLGKADGVAAEHATATNIAQPSATSLDVEARSDIEEEFSEGPVRLQSGARRHSRTSKPRRGWHRPSPGRGCS